MSFDFIYVVIVLAVILFSMTIHEAMHAYVGYWLGDNTAKLQGRLTLNTIKHIDPFMTIILPITLALVGAPIFGGAKPVPFNPHNIKFGEWGGALIAIAGPLTNFIIAFVSFGVWVMFGMPDKGVSGQIFIVLISVNLGFFIFNMIPIPPLDGSRVLYALAPEFIRRAMEYIERYGVVLVFIVVIFASSSLVGFISSAINFFISLFGNIFIV